MSATHYDDPEFQGMLETLIRRLQDGEAVSLTELTRDRPGLRPPLEQAKQNWAALHEATSSTDISDRSVQAERLLQAKAEFHGYRLTGLLGKGGCAIVCGAIEIESQREVAIKFLTTAQVSRTLLQKEAQSLIALTRASHVVKLLHVNKVDDLPYLVMERVDGISLADLIAQNGNQPFPACRTLHILRGICQALAEVERLSEQDDSILDIVHADIKPSNIMIGPDDEVTLLDFGIARLIRSDTGGPTENTLAKMVGFTSAYAVPEVMLGSNPTRASDIFQIGLVGYQLATGKNYWAVQIEQRSERLSDAVLGSKLKESLAKALAWDVTKRHPSAVEFLADLGNCGRRSLISIFTGKRVCIGGLLMVILGVLLTLYLANWGARAQQDSLPVVQTQPAPPLSANPRVAVLYFKNHSLDVNTLTSLSKGLCSMVITDLDHRSDYDLVERTRIQEVLRELEMTSGGAFDKSATAKIGKLVGAEYLLFGSFFLAVEKFRMDARLVEVERGIVVASAGVTGKSSEFDVLAFRLVEMILAEHHHGRHTVAAARSTDLTDVGVDLDCAARFGLALDHRDKGRKSEALETLDSVVRMNPQFDNARNLLVKWRATDKADPAADRKSTPIPKGESIDQSP